MVDPTDAALGLIESCRGLRTEIDRLRAALQTIADYERGGCLGRDADEMIDIARHILER